ncbi:O-antigen ligase family protein [Patulibacter minatonensis]|uniref:O-antigen ligase family protein n=1 Tax=Patulibacter minatonensis TaxID=298163 RepID=UPI00047AE4DC|nr:O-antigen ligase family protein [Patulibacter minatonensis]
MAADPATVAGGTARVAAPPGAATGLRGRLTAVARGDTPWVVLIAALLVWVATKAKTGDNLAVTTPPLLAITVISGLIAVASALWAPRGSRNWGAGTLLAALAVVVVTGLSITWSVSPESSWFEANRTFAYVAVMVGGAAAARLSPGRWQAPLGGVLLGSTLICALGLCYKVFPQDLPTELVFARLQDPLGYWNAVGALAAFALVLALWLGTRRDGYRPLNALAYPIAGLMVITLLLTYSRGGLAAAAVGIALWLALSPRRLHSLLVLAVGLLGGGFVAIWAFAKADLSTDKVVLVSREAAGTEFGVLLVAALVFLLVVGLVIEFATVFAGVGTLERRRLGTTILVAVALIPLAGFGLLATSERGLTGSISHAYDQITDPPVALPAGDPSRLTAVQSTRSNYWRQAFRLFDQQQLRGVGAGGFSAVQSRARRNDGAVARHAHGWIPQTMADMGLLGMLTQLALAVAFLVAAARAVGLRGPLRTGARTPERDGIAAAIGVVAAFAVTSVADWNWFVPAVALPMMLLAGWVVGRGAEAAFAGGGLGERAKLRLLSPRVGVATAALLVTLIGAFSLLQPWRADRANDEALNTLADAAGQTGPRRTALLAEARREAEHATDLDPLSTNAIRTRASERVASGDIDGARAYYQQIVDREPSAPGSWELLATFELRTAERPRAALKAAGIALKMAPTLRTAGEVAILATRQIAAKIQIRDQERAAKKAARNAKTAAGRKDTAVSTTAAAPSGTTATQQPGAVAPTAPAAPTTATSAAPAATTSTTAP